MAEDRDELLRVTAMTTQTKRRRHNAVTATLRALKRGEQGQHGGVRSSGQGVFNVRAHPDTLQRIGEFLDLLLATAKTNGFKFVQLDDAMGFMVAGEAVPVAISQTIIRTRHVATSQEERRLESWRQRLQSMRGLVSREDYPEIPTWDYRPTGEMKFEIGGWPRPRGITHVFKDSRARKIEERMTDIMSSLEAHAQFLTERRVLAARANAQREEIGRQRAYQQHKSRLEQQRLDYLETKLAEFSRLERLERLLRRTKTSNVDANSNFMRWLQDHVDDLAIRVSLEAMVAEADELPAFQIQGQP